MAVARRSDTGASLLLAVLFLFVVSLVIVGVVRWAGSDISNSSRFVLAQSVESEANSGTAFAVQFVRYNFLNTSLDGQTPSSCWTTGGTGAVSETDLNDPNGSHAVDSWCMTRNYLGDSQNTREVTISTCLATVSAADCAQQPLLQAIVTIVDGVSGCNPTASPSSAPNTCGDSLTISHWQFDPTPPVVSSVTTASSGTLTCPSGTPSTLVDVNGSNLLGPTNVDLVVDSSAQTTLPEMFALPTADYSANSTGTTIQACIPQDYSSLGSLDVVVSTYMGSSVIGPSSLWPAG